MSTTKSKDMGELTASLVGIGAVITISGAGALWTWSGYGDLPAQVAAGWGIDGRVTRFIAPGMLWGIALGLSFGLPLLLAVLGLFLRIGRVLSPIAGGVATLLTVSLNGMLMNQRGLTEEQVLASSVPSPVPLLFVGMLTAILVGVGMAFALRRRPDGQEVPVALDDADPRLAVDEDIRVAWTGRTRVGRGVLAVLGASAVVTLILMICWLGFSAWLTSAPRARSRTARVNSLTTGSATSASSSARRMSRIVLLMSDSVRRPLPRRFLKVAVRRSDRVVNTGTG